MHVPSIGFAQNGTAPRGDHALLRLSQLVDHLLLLIPETVLALAGKKLPDRAAQAVLDLMVGIDKRLAKTARQLAANGGFARAGKAHKDDAQRKSLAEKISVSPQAWGLGFAACQCIRRGWGPCHRAAPRTATDSGSTDLRATLRPDHRP